MHPETLKTLKISYPIIIANLSQIIMGIIDNAMVGTINSTLLAAASLVNNLITLPYVLCVGLSIAISPLVATAAGTESQHKIPSYFTNGLLVCGLFVLLLAIGMHLGSSFIHYLGQDKSVAELGESYLKWMAWSMVPMTLFLTMKHFSDGIEETSYPMILSVASIPANILLNYILIYGNFGAPRLELEGAGIATFITRILLLVGMVFLLFRMKKYHLFLQDWYRRIKPDKTIIRQILRIGIPTSSQYAMEAWAFSFSGVMVGWLGATAQAAHQIALSLAAVSFMAVLGLSAGGSIRVSNAFGKNNIALIRIIGTGTVKTGLVYGAVCAVLFAVFRNQLPYLFNEEYLVVKQASILLLLAAIFQISDSAQAIGVGLCRGIHDVRVPTFFIALAYWIIGIPSGYVLAFTFGLGASGIWIGLILGLSASAILLNIRFFRKIGQLELQSQI
jgi:multidrug resistance protein, MATE family